MASRTRFLLPTLQRVSCRKIAVSSAVPVSLFATRKFHAASLFLNKPGSHSRTDAEVEIEYPAEHDLPSSKPVHGTGGQYVKPTLASFSLDGNVGVVTGGARGLGLVIGQGMVYSGSDLALVDMNSKLSACSGARTKNLARHL